ncbi:MAG: hypothetical protein ACTSO2_20345, partial [Promethearchaeota archaeon]
TKNDNSYKKTNLSNAETFYNFKVNTYFKEKRTNEQILTEDIPTLFKEYLEKKADVKNRVNMEIAFMDGKGGGKELFPLYMALATYTKFNSYMDESKTELPIYMIFLSRIITSVTLKKSLDDTKVIFFPKFDKRAYRVSIFNTFEKPNATTTYIIESEGLRKTETETELQTAIKDYKEKLNSFSTVLDNEGKRYSRNLRAFKLILNFTEVKNLLKDNGEVKGVEGPFNYPVENINNTYDDIPINEQAGIFIGVNILEDIFRNTQKGAPPKRGAYFLQSGLSKYTLHVIKVLKKEDEDERQITAEWTKSDADYESNDIVVEIKSREPQKISDGNISWLVNSLSKAEKQVAITLEKRKKNKNIGFVVSLFNLNYLPEKEGLQKPYIYLIVEALIYK